MFETMYEAPGIGLAAIQVGIPKRVLVIDLQEPVEEEGGEPVKDPRVFINPEILERSDAGSAYNEGCLSVPDQYADVERPDIVRARWLDENGKQQEGEFDGLMSVCLQHEIDHLERHPVHRPSVAAEARHDPQEARQAAQGPREGGDPLAVRSDRRRGLAAIVGAFAAHLRAQLAMFVVVLLALGGAFVADAGADSSISLSTASFDPARRTAKLAGRLADVGAVEAGADALRMSISSATQASAQLTHIRAQYIKWWAASPSGWFTWPLHVGVKGNHLADGHSFSSSLQSKRSNPNRFRQRKLRLEHRLRAA
jgi:peptide deformylase